LYDYIYFKKEEKYVKKVLLYSFAGALMLGVQSPTYATPAEASTYVQEIVQMQPGSTSQEVLREAQQVAQMEHRSVEDVLKGIHRELAADVKLGEEEMTRHLQSGKGKRRFLVFSVKGNVFYTDAKTGKINHGHVGIYYSDKEIVESTAKYGVRRKKAKETEVSPGAVIQSVSTSTKKRNAAANWANSRVGKDDYSYNFATNRHTDHYGDKNCSKLVWSSFILKAGIDVDKDKGSGVYPRDIRDSSLTKTVKTIP
jgi:uncharacterized protein YycO